MQKSGLRNIKHHPDGSFKLIVLFSAFVNLSAGARYTKCIAKPVSRVLSLAFLQYYFSGVVDISKYPRHQLIINEVAKSFRLL